ncbi:hypothetical protein [Aeromicrobium sp. IC_218]|uniref:hypothetical protein n=1 Tax=Aeromicrobium sp. IC_218 TaxID=2545468 RepID=UPI00103A5B50|nr:hypothetical protein [Aeromicrobium sp. IC_218]TCI95900.1 hypothetical protein E0W78_15820 [Aeromicrobium sp. IC_218]
MSEESTARDAPLWRRPYLLAALVFGLGCVVAGGVAVFVTDNELGSASLVAAGVAVAGFGVFGDRVRSVEAGGVKLGLEQRAEQDFVAAAQARATGDVERAARLERRAAMLRTTAAAVGTRYEHLRASQPSGWDRTKQLEAVMQSARDMDTSALSPADVEDVFDTGGEGNRVVALALIERDPRLATLEVLKQATVHSRSSFEQYHGLSAAEAALPFLSPDDRLRLRRAVEALLIGPLGDSSSDRRTVARRILDATRADEERVGDGVVPGPPEDRG